MIRITALLTGVVVVIAVVFVNTVMRTRSCCYWLISPWTSFIFVYLDVAVVGVLINYEAHGSAKRAGWMVGWQRSVCLSREPPAPLERRAGWVDKVERHSIAWLMVVIMCCLEFNDHDVVVVVDYNNERSTVASKRTTTTMMMMKLMVMNDHVPPREASSNTFDFSLRDVRVLLRRASTCQPPADHLGWFYYRSVTFSCGSTLFFCRTKRPLPVLKTELVREVYSIIKKPKKDFPVTQIFFKVWIGIPSHSKIY